MADLMELYGKELDLFLTRMVSGETTVDDTLEFSRLIRVEHTALKTYLKALGWRTESRTIKRHMDKHEKRISVWVKGKVVPNDDVRPVRHEEPDMPVPPALPARPAGDDPDDWARISEELHLYDQTLRESDALIKQQDAQIATLRDQVAELPRLRDEVARLETARDDLDTQRKQAWAAYNREKDARLSVERQLGDARDEIKRLKKFETNRTVIDAREAHARLRATLDAHKENKS